MMNIVRAGGLTGFPSLVSRLGGDPAAVLQSCGLAMGDLADPERHVPYRNAILAIEEAAQRLGVRDFGLRLCAVQDLGFLGVLALAIQSASSVREGMLLGAKHMHFHTPGLGFRSFRSADGALECSEVFYRLRPAPCVPQAVEHAVGHMCRLVALLSDQTLRPVSIHFRHAQVGSDAQYIAHLGQLPRFGAAFDGICMDPLAWRQRMPGHNRVLRQFVERFLIGASPSGELPVADQVRQVLGNLLRAGPADLGSVARVLGQHPRTLQRRLRAEGLCFEDLRNGARRDWAGELLMQQGLSLTQVAQLLGFADQSVLTRACRRWFGAAPRTLRQRRAARLA